MTFRTIEEKLRLIRCTAIHADSAFRRHRDREGRCTCVGLFVFNFCMHLQLVKINTWNKFVHLSHFFTHIFLFPTGALRLEGEGDSTGDLSLTPRESERTVSGKYARLDRV